LSGVVFDSSCILAAILGESGDDEVFTRIAEAVISSVNVAEVYTYAAIKTLPTDAVDALFADTGIEVVPLSHSHAVIAGRIAAVTRRAGLSLGDRACLALASERDAEVLTADRVWAAFADDIGLKITLLR
jgi:PIN domain nuclease of toxin-antitoxin system